MIDLATLSEFNPVAKVVVGRIYYLLYMDVVIYVGKTTDISSRIDAHAATKNFDKILFEECPVEDLRKREREAVIQFRPILNGEYRNRPPKLFQIIGNHLYSFKLKTSAEIKDGLFYFSDIIFGYCNGERLCYYENKYRFEAFVYDFATDEFVQTYSNFQRFRTGEYKNNDKDIVVGELYIDKENVTVVSNTRVLKKYIPAPKSPFQDQTLPDDYLFRFGKYKGATCASVKAKDANYIAWFEETISREQW